MSAIPPTVHEFRAKMMMMLAAIFYIGTPLRQRLRYIKVIIGVSLSVHKLICHLVAEMHGNEDGSIPATFQVIFVVSFASSFPLFVDG